MKLSLNTKVEVFPKGIEEEDIECKNDIECNDIYSSLARILSISGEEEQCYIMIISKHYFKLFTCIFNYLFVGARIQLFSLLIIKINKENGWIQVTMC